MTDLVHIRAVAEHVGLPLSTLHYRERRGLLTPERRGDGRWYDTDQLYRVALIKTWRDTGQLGVEEIAGVLAATGPAWRETVHARIAAIEEQRARLAAARGYLEHLLTCQHTAALEECPNFLATVGIPGAPAGRSPDWPRPAPDPRAG
ncbi:MerR family transcriptional regulator [Pseudonocardia sp. GCM10023141]|uniref:MerR family transcriptional regulator n=1 Tax=Pseudonocardia sp. GCM10023141 TaxID=3252653 RepID=UPI00360AC47C